MFEVLLAICFVALVLASVHDLKTREVPDYLSYTFICVGILIQIYYVLKSFDLNYGLYVLLNFVGASSFGMLMYRAKQWGGADTKLTIALSLFLMKPSNIWLFSNYFLNFLLVGAFYGVSGSLFLIIKKRKKFFEVSKKEFGTSKYYYFASLTILSIGIIFLFLQNFLSGFFIIVGILGLLSIFLKNADKLMIKSISINKLTEGDWVIDKIVINDKVLFDPKKEVDVKLKQITKMKSEGVRTVKIIEGMPFVPAFLIAFVITMFKSDFFLSVITGLVFPAFLF
ncbi:MAG: prepilin peptidase [Nanoarchaeota archaeon]|nr:prepilin peptidase [Nanoarchaeota archaeon]